MPDATDLIQIRSERLTCADPYDERSAFLGLHSNPLFEISLVTSGAGIHRVLDRDIPCRMGDMFIVPAETPHGYFSESSGECLCLRQLFFCVEDWFEGEISNRSGYRYCYGAFREGFTLSYAALNAHTAEKVCGIWDLIEQELATREEDWRDAVGSMLSYLMITIARYINASIKSLSFASSDEWDLVSRAIKEVREDYGDPALTQEELAARLFVSKSHFGRSFHRITGKFFSEYLRDLRLQCVCRLLQSSDANVEDIAHKCGFRNMPSFYKNFHTHVGMTPKEYRQSVHASDSRSKEYVKLLKEERIMSILNEICENVQRGKSKLVKELVEQALDAGVKPADILDLGLLAGMSIVGEKFKNNEVYVPEVLVAARAMNMGSQVLKPHLVEAGVTATGRVCIGTVQGDLHDIGKNLVKMMMEGKGLEVIDLGTDVSPDTFIKTAIEQDCRVICCSALLTTTMQVMEEVVRAAEAAGIRDRVKIMIGGAPVSQEFCNQIGADCYTVDAASAADAAVELCKQP